MADYQRCSPSHINEKIGYSACLSDAMNEMHRVVSSIENGLGKRLLDNGSEGKHGPSDMLVVAEMELVD